MDHNYAESTEQRSQHSSYSLRVLSDEEVEAWLPGLITKYLQVARQGLEMASSVKNGLAEGIICLCLREDAPIGFIGFTNIGIRDAAQIHMAFWGTSVHRRRAEMVREACKTLCESFNLLRVEAFIAADRPDVSRFAEAAGGIHVGRIPHAYRDVSGIPQDHELYIYVRE